MDPKAAQRSRHLQIRTSGKSTFEMAVSIESNAGTQEWISALSQIVRLDGQSKGRSRIADAVQFESLNTPHFRTSYICH